MDLRTITLGVPPQEVSQEPGGGPGAVQVRVQVLTKDSVTVSVDAVVYYRVSNATISVANVEDAHSSTRSAGNATMQCLNVKLRLLSAKNITDGRLSDSLSKLPVGCDHCGDVLIPHLLRGCSLIT